jgi:5-methylcytosine-specific restriction endonuclease McrA
MKPCYATWRKIILKRDGYKCQLCGAKEKTMCVHHIIPVKERPDLILNFENGITLCQGHHKTQHAKGKSCRG